MFYNQLDSGYWVVWCIKMFESVCCQQQIKGGLDTRIYVFPEVVILFFFFFFLVRNKDKYLDQGEKAAMQQMPVVAVLD